MTNAPKKRKSLKADTEGRLIRAYKYRIYPNAEQKTLLAKHFGAHRFVFNACLDKAIHEYEESKKRVDFLELRNKFVRYELSEDNPWLKEEIYASVLDQTVVKDFSAAFTNFFKRRSEGVGFPKFKSRKDNYQSFGLPVGCKGFTDDQRYVKVPKKCGGLIRVRAHRPLPDGTIKTCRVSRTPSNRYYISITVDEGTALPPVQAFNDEKVLGIDLGLTHFATLSTGEKIDVPKFLQQSLIRKQVLSRRVSRKKRGSKNRQKARLRLAKLDERIANQRNHVQHEVSRLIIDNCENQAIAVETLNIKGMVKNRHLSRHIADVAWASFVAKLEYKARWAGKRVIKIDRWAPSSKRCSICGYKKEEMPLHIREWQCPECRTIHDRDVNAARNIRQYALEEYYSGGNTAGEPADSLPLGRGMNQEPSVYGCT